MKIIPWLLMLITARLPMRIINDGKRPYLERYYLGTLFGWRFYLHRFVGSDPDRGLHDHPWLTAYSLILSGWYWEELRTGTRRVRWLNRLTGDTFHRVVLPKYPDYDGLHERGFLMVEQPCWTLFCHRVARVKPWGFLKPIEGEVDIGAQVFIPHQYLREGNQDQWWLTAPSRATLEAERRS